MIVSFINLQTEGSNGGQSMLRKTTYKTVGVSDQVLGMLREIQARVLLETGQKISLNQVVEHGCKLYLKELGEKERGDE